jgi:hypothetical protein
MAAIVDTPSMMPMYSHVYNAYKSAFCGSASEPRK